MNTFYLMSNGERSVIDNDPDGTLKVWMNSHRDGPFEVRSTIVAEDWLTAKAAFGFELSTLQAAMLKTTSVAERAAIQKVGRSMTTQDRIDAILARDADEKAGAGGIAYFTHYELVGVPNGRLDYTKATHGPLRGQVSKDWTLTMFYADGTKKVSSDLGTMRGVPTLA